MNIVSVPVKACLTDEEINVYVNRHDECYDGEDVTEIDVDTRGLADAAALKAYRYALRKVPSKPMQNHRNKNRKVKMTSKYAPRLTREILYNKGAFRKSFQQRGAVTANARFMLEDGRLGAIILYQDGSYVLKWGKRVLMRGKVTWKLG